MPSRSSATATAVAVQPPNSAAKKRKLDVSGVDMSPSPPSSAKKSNTQESASSSQEQSSSSSRKSTPRSEAGVEPAIRKSPVRRAKLAAAREPTNLDSLYDDDWSTIFEDHIMPHIPNPVVVSTAPTEDNIAAANTSMVPREELVSFIADQLIHYGFLESQRELICAMIYDVATQYYDNSYHSFTHAIHVMTNCSYFLSKIENSADLNTPVFGKIENLAVIYAALIHDIGHLGVSNYALINKQHYLATMYHDQSIAEMHSLTLGLDRVFHTNPERKHRPQDSNNTASTEEDFSKLLDHFSVEERRLFRKYVIELVLGTDIADMYKKKLVYDKLQDLSDDTTGHLDCRSNEGKLTLMVLLLRSCDVGSSMQSISACKYWAKRFYIEIKLASIYGDGPIINPAHYYSTQIKYFEGHSLFLVEKLTVTGMVKKEQIELMQSNVTANIKEWIRYGKKLIKDWERDDVLLRAVEHQESLANPSL